MAHTIPPVWVIISASAEMGPCGIIEDISITLADNHDAALSALVSIAYHYVPESEECTDEATRLVQKESIMTRLRTLLSVHEGFCDENFGGGACIWNLSDRPFVRATMHAFPPLNI